MKTIQPKVSGVSTKDTEPEIFPGGITDDTPKADTKP
jgi:hypothetical protein